ncbi:hypothetical protein ABXM61_12065, partial [Enterococcus faecium]
WLKTLYRKRAVTWPFIFYTIIWTLSLLEKFSEIQSYNTKILEEYVSQNNRILEILIEQNRGSEL